MNNEISRKWASLCCQSNPKRIMKKFNSSFCDHVILSCSILFLSFPTLHSQLRFEVLFRTLNNCHVSNLKIVISKSLLLWLEIKNYFRVEISKFKLYFCEIKWLFTYVQQCCLLIQQATQHNESFIVSQSIIAIVLQLVEVELCFRNIKKFACIIHLIPPNKALCKMNNMQLDNKIFLILSNSGRSRRRTRAKYTQ